MITAAILMVWFAYALSVVLVSGGVLYLFWTGELSLRAVHCAGVMLLCGAVALGMMTYRYATVLSALYNGECIG